MNVQSSDIVSKLFVDQRDDSWADGELMMLRPETEVFKHIAERVFALQCPIGLYTLSFHLLGHLVEDFKRFRSIPSTNKRRFEHFNLLNKQPRRTTSRLVWTRLQEMLQNMCSTVQYVRRGGDEREAT